MNLKSLLFVMLGVLFLLLGAIGAFIPVWPTTPFVLAAVGFLSAAPKLRAKVLAIPFFKAYYQSYYHKKGLPPKTWVFSLVFLWVMLGLSIYLVNILWLKGLLGAIGLGVTLHILWLSRDRRGNQAPNKGGKAP